MKEFKVGDLVRYHENHLGQVLYLVLETPNSTFKEIRIKSVVDGLEYWEMSSYLEEA